MDSETQQTIEDIIAGKEQAVRKCLFEDCLPGFRYLSARFRHSGGYTTEAIISLAYSHLREYDWSALKAYRGDIPLAKYIVLITRRLLGKLAKAQEERERKERPLDETIVNGAISELYSTRKEEENRRRLFELLDTLPDRERRVLVYFKLQGYSAEEVAEKLGTTPQNVYNLSKRAIAKLKQKVTHEQ